VAGFSFKTQNLIIVRKAVKIIKIITITILAPLKAIISQITQNVIILMLCYLNVKIKNASTNPVVGKNPKERVG